jgi:hypothetical protein
MSRGGSPGIPRFRIPRRACASRHLELLSTRLWALSI